jgi:hypothetical protein
MVLMQDGSCAGPANIGCAGAIMLGLNRSKKLLLLCTACCLDYNKKPILQADNSASGQIKPVLQTLQQ